MESRAFIKAAGATIAKLVQSSPRDENRDALQREVNQLFSGLQNPTLPSAYRLRDAALRNGFNVDQKVLQRLSQFEFVS